MTPIIGIGIGVPFKSGSQSWAEYWATRYISTLVVETTSASEQTITATIVGTGFDNCSFEVSVDNGITWTVAGNALDGIYSATGLISDTLYLWRARLFKGTNYGTYSIVDYDRTDPHANLIAGYKLDGADFFSNTGAYYAILDVANRHSAICYNGVTYIAYMGNDDDPYITTYTHATSVWATPVKIGINPKINGDAHGQPAILIDNDGYIHCMFGAHVSAIQYSKSNNPEDISAWTVMGSPDTGTYPQLLQFSDDTIYLFYRYTSGGSYYWGYKTSVNGGTNWGAVVPLVYDFIAYGFFEKGVGDFIHATFAAGDSDADRQNIYYMYYDGAWKNIGDTSIITPLGTDDGSILAYDSGAEWIPCIGIDYDGSNNPFFLFGEGHTADPVGGGPGTFTYKLLKRKNSAWVVYSLGCTTDHWRDFQSALDVRTATDFDAYLIRQGTADAIGGNIEKWISTDTGETWTLSSLIQEGQFVEPALIRNYHANARLVFFEYIADPTTWTRKGYLWGDSGFIKNAAITIAPEIKGLYNGTIVNAPALVAGQFGNCYSFVGASLQSIQIADNAALSFTNGASDTPVTVTMWINTPAITTKILFSKFIASHAEYMYLLSTNVIQQGFYDPAAGKTIYATAPFTTLNAWKFICFTYDGSENRLGLKIYIDLIESQTVQTESGGYVGMTNETSPVFIARRYETGTPYYYTGMIDELKVWNKVLSGAEMAALMVNTL